MRIVSRHTLLLLLLASASFGALALDEPQDTVYFYTSWRQLMDATPDTMIVDAMIDVYSPYELYFETDNKKVNKRIKKEYIAASLSDSVCLVNSNYLKGNFKGDSKKLHGYVPLFFNETVAYAVAEECIYAELGDVGLNVITTFNYYIDFQRRKVFRIDDKKLSILLADYPNLKMSFEGMVERKKTSVINHFFFRYVDRATDDLTRPEILELVP